MRCKKSGDEFVNKMLFHSSPQTFIIDMNSSEEHWISIWLARPNRRLWIWIFLVSVCVLTKKTGQQHNAFYSPTSISGCNVGVQKGSVQKYDKKCIVGDLKLKITSNLTSKTS